MEARSASLRKLYMRGMFTVIDSCTRLKLQACSKSENKIRDIQYSRLCGLMVRTADSYACGRRFDSYLTYIFFQVFVCLFLELYVRVNKFSVMSGRFSLFIG